MENEPVNQVVKTLGRPKLAPEEKKKDTVGYKQYKALLDERYEIEKQKYPDLKRPRLNDVKFKNGEIVSFPIHLLKNKRRRTKAERLESLIAELQLEKDKANACHTELECKPNDPSPQPYAS